MLIGKAPDLRFSDVTPPGASIDRRQFLRAAGIAAAGVAHSLVFDAADIEAQPRRALEVRSRIATTSDKQTPYNAVTTYNNFYEFGSSKNDPARNAGPFKSQPWSVAVEG